MLINKNRYAIDRGFIQNRLSHHLPKRKLIFLSASAVNDVGVSLMNLDLKASQNSNNDTFKSIGICCSLIGRSACKFDSLFTLIKKQKYRLYYKVFQSHEIINLKFSNNSKNQSWLFLIYFVSFQIQKKFFENELGK